MKEGSLCASDARADATHERCGKPHRAQNHAMKYARPRERSEEGGYPEDPTGGHMNTPHTSQDMCGRPRRRRRAVTKRGAAATFFFL